MKKSVKSIFIFSTLFILCLNGFKIYSETKQLDEKEVKAITQACMDYVEGFYESSKERIENGVFDGLVKREASEKITSIRTKEGLIKNALSKKRVKPDIKVFVFDIYKNIAMASVISEFVDYCQLAKIDGKWKVVNVLWIFK